jgi:hypothetical protein
MDSGMLAHVDDTQIVTLGCPRLQLELSDEVLEEVEWFVLTLLPSWRWLSPIHLWKYEPARQRLIAALVHTVPPRPSSQIYS